MNNYTSSETNVNVDTSRHGRGSQEKAKTQENTVGVPFDVNDKLE